MRGLEPRLHPRPGDAGRVARSPRKGQRALLCRLNGPTSLKTLNIYRPFNASCANSDSLFSVHNRVVPPALERSRVQAVEDLRSGAFCAAIVTSQKAALALRDALLHSPPPLPPDPPPPPSGGGAHPYPAFFTVGARSAEILSAAGCSIALSAASAAELAAALAPSSLAAWSASRLPALFFGSEDRLETLPRALAASGIPLVEHHLYRTAAEAPALIDRDLAVALGPDAIVGSGGAGAVGGGAKGGDNVASGALGDVPLSEPPRNVVAVFFSPSGVRAVAASDIGRQVLFAQSGAGGEGEAAGSVTRKCRVVAVAFGPSTLAALHTVLVEGRESLVSIVMCESPDAAGLKMALFDESGAPRRDVFPSAASSL